MKKYIYALVMLVALCSLAVTGRAKIMDHSADVPGIPAIDPHEFQPIRASITNKDPSQFTIDVRKFANIGVNEDAPIFAVYIGSSLPDKCGDYRDLELSYRKPSKYKRTFNLSEHEEVLKAIDSYKCVVIRNNSPSS